MNQLFSEDSPLVIGVKKVLDIVLLNFIWLLTSLPIVTLGAAAASFYDVVYKDIWHDRGMVFTDYFSSFRRNLRQGLLCGLIFAAAAAVLAVDLSLLRSAEEAGHIWGNLWILVAAFFAFLAVYFIWTAAGIARFEAPLKTILKNSLALMITHLPVSLAVGLLVAACVLCIWLVPGALFVLPALCMLVCCRLIHRVFLLYMSEEERRMEEERNRTGRSRRGQPDG